MAAKKIAAKAVAPKKLAPKKPVAKPAAKKPVAKVAPKKIAAKVAPKKIAAKVAPKKIAAKVAPKKAAPSPKRTPQSVSRAASQQRELAAVVKKGPRAVVEQVFSDAGWSFATEELSDGVVAFHVEVNEDIREVRAVLDPANSRFRLYFVYDTVASEDRRVPAALYVTLANADLSDGNFELALDNGEVRYKTSLDFCAVDLSPYLVRNMIFHAMELTEVYGPGLVEVIEAGRDPQTAIDEAEGL